MVTRTDPLKELHSVQNKAGRQKEATLKHTSAPVSTQIEAVGRWVHETVAWES